MSLTGLVFLIAFLGGCGFALARHPIYGLLTYVAVFYLHPPSRWWGQTLPDLRWSLSAAGVTLLAVWLHRRKLSAEGPSLMSHGLTKGLIAFVVWVWIQSLWALDAQMHADLRTIFTKFLVVVYLIYRCVDSERNLRLFMWAHALGCGYIAWIATFSYDGGRFEDFGGPGIGEANAGALQIVTAIVTAGALLLEARKWLQRGVLVGLIPLLVNALVTTISRSGFLAGATAGLIFNLFAPKRMRGVIGILSVLAVVLMLGMTTSQYWNRIGSIAEMGEEVEGRDTGSGRLTIMKAQLRMWQAYPLGCGHRCTVTLSPAYLDAKHLTGTGEQKGRASHNTVFSLLVEQGTVGVVLYAMLLVWLFVRIVRLRTSPAFRDGILSVALPTVAGVIGAIMLGDMFVDHLKSEVRIWFLSLLLVLIRLGAIRNAQDAAVKNDAAAAPATPRNTLPTPPSVAR